MSKESKPGYTDKDRRAAAERVAHLDTSIPLSGPIREIEIFLLRYGAMSNSPLVELENMMPGGGILVAYDGESRKFKIEISQIEGRR